MKDVELFQDRPRTQDHTLQRTLGGDNRHPGLVYEALVETAQESTTYTDFAGLHLYAGQAAASGHGAYLEELPPELRRHDDHRELEAEHHHPVHDGLVPPLPAPGRGGHRGGNTADHEHQADHEDDSDDSAIGGAIRDVPERSAEC